MVLHLTPVPDPMPEDDEPEAKIVHLPGTDLTPEVVLHRTLDELHKIKSVVVVIHYKDDSTVIDYSRQPISTVAVSAVLLHSRASKLLTEGDET